MDNSLAIRRVLVTLNEVGKTATIIGNFKEIEKLARGFGTARGWPFAVEEVETGAKVTHVSKIERKPAFAQVDTLQIGESVILQVQQPQHQQVRSAMSARGRDGKRAFHCQREGDFIRVTRLPATDEERAAAGLIDIKRPTTKWDLERLEHVASVHFAIERKEHHKVRLAATNKARLMGWKLTCKVDPRGITVTRTA